MSDSRVVLFKKGWLQNWKLEGLGHEKFPTVAETDPRSSAWTKRICGVAAEVRLSTGHA
jgi:hypothetical protein